MEPFYCGFDMDIERLKLFSPAVVVPDEWTPPQSVEEALEWESD